MSSDKIHATIIEEVIGKPPEHLVETLEDLIKAIGGEKGVKLVNKKIHPPVLVKDQKELFVSFAEVELECINVSALLTVCFKYMPANIEISAPSSLNIQHDHLNEIVNNLLMKLHQYDETARILQAEKNILNKKVSEELSKKEKNSEKQ